MPGDPYLDERYDGSGYPDHLQGKEIPLLSRIMNLAQSVEVFLSQHGVMDALDMARRRRGLWFDPSVVDALDSLRNDPGFWESLHPGVCDLRGRLLEQEPPSCVWSVDEEHLDRVTMAFAKVVDAKSVFTARHSEQVAWAARGIASVLGHSSQECKELYRAGLLHDIGKLGVPRRILEKPDKLDDSEWKIIRLHTEYTMDILEQTHCFRHLALMASCHHERLDGSGYHLGIDEELMPWGSRLLAAADLFDALSANRPYRKALPRERVLQILHEERSRGLCSISIEALEFFLRDAQDPYAVPEQQAPAPLITPVAVPNLVPQDLTV